MLCVILISSNMDGTRKKRLSYTRVWKVARRKLNNQFDNHVSESDSSDNDRDIESNTGNDWNIGQLNDVPLTTQDHQGNINSNDDDAFDHDHISSDFANIWRDIDLFNERIIESDDDYDDVNEIKDFKENLAAWANRAATQSQLSITHQKLLLHHEPCPKPPPPRLHTTKQTTL